jgi:hypothetical protein
MYMMEKRVKDAAAADERAFLKAQGHNLSQASGWIRSWPRFPLTGANSFTTFSIPFNPDAAVATLSVVKAGQSFSEIHDDLAEKLGVKLCATLPQSVIEKCFARGGTAIDLHVFMGFLRGRGRIPEASALQLLNGYFDDCVAACNIPVHHPAHPFHEEFDLAMRLLGMRSLTANNLADRKNESQDWLGLFSDLSVVDCIKIAIAIANGVVLARYASATNVVDIMANLRHYDVAICILSEWRPETAQRASELTTNWMDMYKAGKLRSGFVIALDAHYGAGAFSLHPKTGPSHLKLQLDGFERHRPARGH